MKTPSKGFDFHENPRIFTKPYENPRVLTSTFLFHVTAHWWVWRPKKKPRRVSVSASSYSVAIQNNIFHLLHQNLFNNYIKYLKCILKGKKNTRKSHLFIIMYCYVTGKVLKSRWGSFSPCTKLFSQNFLCGGRPAWHSGKFWTEASKSAFCERTLAPRGCMLGNPPWIRQCNSPFIDGYSGLMSGP